MGKLLFSGIRFKASLRSMVVESDVESEGVFNFRDELLSTFTASFATKYKSFASACNLW